MGVTREDVVAARDSLPEELRDCTTACSIQALLTYTAENGGRLNMYVPAMDLERLLMSGMVRLGHLEQIPGDKEHFRIWIEGGEVLRT